MPNYFFGLLDKMVIWSSALRVTSLWLKGYSACEEAVFYHKFFFHVRLSINKQNLLHLYMSQGTQLYVVYLYERTVTLKTW